jgi:ATP-dependent protease ClpP protease subunit
MVDTNVIIGVAVGVLGLGGGIGLVAFAEGQAERFDERGSDAMSDETKTKLASQFMEDVEMQAVGLDDTISKMEAAMAKRQGVDVEELEKDIEVDEVLDDGW